MCVKKKHTDQRQDGILYIAMFFKINDELFYNEVNDCMYINNSKSPLSQESFYQFLLVRNVLTFFTSSANISHKLLIKYHIFILY